VIVVDHARVLLPPSDGDEVSSVTTAPTTVRGEIERFEASARREIREPISGIFGRSRREKSADVAIVRARLASRLDANLPRDEGREGVRARLPTSFSGLRLPRRSSSEAGFATSMAQARGPSQGDCPHGAAVLVRVGSGRGPTMIRWQAIRQHRGPGSRARQSSVRLRPPPSGWRSSAARR